MEGPSAPSATNGKVPDGDFRTLLLEELHESAKNPRTHYEPVALKQLADNLTAVGQITPVVVRPRPKGKGGYELAAGHRRLRAAKLAGLTALNAVVRDLDEAQFVEILNIENLQRDDLNALEEAQGFVALMTDAGYDVPKIAERVGRSIKYVYDRVKLLQLIPAAKKLLADGTITPGHGILLARLSKEDQQRALGDVSRNGSDGGVMEHEHIDETYFAHREPELTLDDPKKARSVRELQQWIDRNVRFVPEKVDQADLHFDLPGTAELLTTAVTNKLKVVKITREYRVPDEARDGKERTYGNSHWKRADGEMEDQDPWSDRKPKPSKTCAHSQPGLVVAGPGRGEAFLVCVNKDKCSVHWSEEMQERAKRAKARERVAAQNGGAATSAPAKAAKPDPNVLPHELREKWTKEELTARVPEIVKGVKAVIGELKISDEICWNLASDALDIQLSWGWRKVGKREYQGSGSGTEWKDELEDVLGAELPGRFAKGSLRAEDGPGARAELAWVIWLARDSAGLDESIEKALQARWTAHRKTEQKSSAKQPAQTSAKAKKRAGDVARAKKANAKKAAAR